MSSTTINRLTIEGYKSLASEISLEIRPLTILAGANSGGKSSVMQPMLLLKQTLASPSDPGVMEISGPNVKFSRYDQMFSLRPGEKAAAGTMKFGFFGENLHGGGDACGLELRYRLDGNDLVLERQTLSFREDEGDYCWEATHDGELTAEEVNALPDPVREWSRYLPPPDKTAVFRNRLNRGFYDLAFGESDEHIAVFSLWVTDRREMIRQQLLNLIHVPGLRGNPQRDYLLRRTKGPRFDGPFQDYVAGIMANWKDHDLRQAALRENMKELGLTWKIETREIDATRVEVLVGRLREARRGGAHDLVNIADVGFGVSQVLPVLVALQVAEPGQMVHLEQPEIHLHPRAQRSLAAILADAARRGVRLVVETHSSILIRGIQTLVAKGKLDPQLVKLHWFTRNETNGFTGVDSADLDENGAFGGDWPEDFDDTYLRAEQEYLDAVETRASQ